MGTVETSRQTSTTAPPAPIITQIISTIGKTKHLLLKPSKIESVPVTKILLRTMRLLLNKTAAEFRSPYQAVACEMAIKTKTDFICVLPTGSGKTMVILLPARIEKATNCTLVVIPLVALMEEMVERWTAAELDVYKWIPSTAHGSVNLDRPSQDIWCWIVREVSFSSFLEDRFIALQRKKRRILFSCTIAIAKEFKELFDSLQPSINTSKQHAIKIKNSSISWIQPPMRL